GDPTLKAAVGAVVAATATTLARVPPAQPLITPGISALSVLALRTRTALARPPPAASGSNKCVPDASARAGSQNLQSTLMSAAVMASTNPGTLATALACAAACTGAPAAQSARLPLGASTCTAD